MINNIAEWVNVKERQPSVNKMYVVKYKRTRLSDERIVVLSWQDDAFFEGTSLKNTEFYSFYWLLDNADITRFEVIDHASNEVGRILTRREINLSCSLQDNERTLKIFLEK